MSQPQIDELRHFAKVADKQARTDLSQGLIAHENDYTSNWTAALRWHINLLSMTGLTATAFVLKGREERGSGCDGTIFITSNSYYKVIRFEAKFPRVLEQNYRWDTCHSKKYPGTSRFSIQLAKQKKWASSFVIFEMFYCEAPIGQIPISGMQSDTSSCVWHRDASNFDTHRTPQLSRAWNKSDLQKLFHYKNSVSIEHILEAVCKCYEGGANKVWGTIPEMAREYGITGSVLHIEVSPKTNKFD